MIEVRVREDSRDVAEEAALFTLHRMQKILESRDVVRWGLSGGNTPKQTYANFVTKVSTDLTHHLEFYWTDERCLPPTSLESNFFMAEQSLLLPLAIHPGQLHRIQGELGPTLAAKEYSALLRKVKLDIAYLGLGTDGHTASIFPNDSIWKDSSEIAIGILNPPTGPQRVSLSPHFLSQSGTTVVIVTGEDKALAVRETLQGHQDTSKWPAQFLRNAEQEVTFFLDRGAASMLEESS